ncbi:MAG: hypothetical protein AABZ02_14645 [Bacteroidota bacterium]
MASNPKNSSEAKFWEWFQENEEKLFDFESNQETVFAELARELQKIHPSLTFEFSSKEKDQRQFVISGGGMKEAFPAVIRLADAAPNLARWQIIKFRPRHSEPCTIGIGEFYCSSDEVEFTLVPEGQKVGVTLYLGDSKNFDEQIFGHIAFLLLDHTLGEYDVETFIGTVDYEPRDVLSTMKRHPLQELPRMFDQFVKSLTN